MIYRNKDFTMYVTKKNIKFGDWKPIINFNHNLFYKFAKISIEDLYNTYGILNTEAWEKHFTKDTGVMYGSYVGNGKTYMIPNERTDIIEFFNRNAPLHLFKKRLRINGLDTYCMFRDTFNSDFEHQMTFFKHNSKDILGDKWDKFVEDMAKDSKKRHIMK
jgi:hypothetical protein